MSWFIVNERVFFKNLYIVIIDNLIWLLFINLFEIKFMKNDVYKY